MAKKRVRGINYSNWQSEIYTYYSEAMAAARRKRREGYKTKVVHNLGRTDPHRVVLFIRKEDVVYI